MGKKDAVSESSQLRPYLITIAVNGFKDYLRKKSTTEVSTESHIYESSEDKNTSAIQDIHYSIQEMSSI